MGDHVALVGMIPAPAHILDQLALMRHQRMVNGNDPTHAVARLRRLLQPCQSLVIERRNVPGHLGQPAVQARLGGREGKFPVDATHGLVFSDDQSRQILSKVASGWLGVKHLTEDRQRILYNGRKVHNGRHNGSLLSGARTLRMPGLAAHYTKSCQVAPLLAVGRNGILVRGFGGQIPPTEQTASFEGQVEAERAMSAECPPALQAPPLAAGGFYCENPEKQEGFLGWETVAIEKGNTGP